MPLVGRPKVWALLLTGWLLAGLACSPPPNPPDALVLRLIVVPSTGPLAGQFAKEYGARERYVRLEVSEGSAEQALAAVVTGQADLALIERAPERAELLDSEHGRPRLRAWPLASDHVAIVVHPSNPVQSLRAAELRRIFEGLERRWSSLGGTDESIQLVSREPGAPARIVFERAILRGSRLAGTAVVMPGDQAVADYVAKHPAAIGYLSSAWVGDAVKAIALDTALSGSTAAGTDSLSHPLVIVTRLGPAAKVRAFVGFCHSRAGRDIVAKLYAPRP